MLYAHFFGGSYGHVIHITAVPNRLKQRIGKTECQDILHRLFAEAMVNAEDLGFVKSTGERLVQCHRAFQVIPYGFLHYDSRLIAVLREASLTEEFRNHPEQRWRSSHVVNAMSLDSPLFLQTC